MPPAGWSTEPESRTPDFRDASRGPRLQKVMAEAGVASRRACEELIESGAVAVNGEIVSELPAWVDPKRDRITINGEGISRPEPHVYVMLFKPRGVVSTNDDEAGRRRAIDLVAHPSRARLFAVGRLDVESSGLLLMTNDGEFANRMTHPRYGVHKVYEITVMGSLDEAEVKKLEAGVFLSDKHSTHGRRSGGRTSPTRLKLIKRGRDRTKLRMELREGRNRQVRRMMLYVGHKVKKLRRVQMGPLKLKGLRAGEWRNLTDAEVDALRAAGREPKKSERRKPGKSRKPSGKASKSRTKSSS